jgi:hypothetical protein
LKNIGTKRSQLTRKPWNWLKAMGVCLYQACLLTEMSETWLARGESDASERAKNISTVHCRSMKPWMCLTAFILRASFWANSSLPGFVMLGLGFGLALTYLLLGKKEDKAEEIFP